VCKALCTVWDTYAEAVPVGDTFDKRMNVRQWVDCMTDSRIITPANCSFVNPVLVRLTHAFPHDSFSYTCMFQVFCMAVMRPKRYQRWRGDSSLSVGFSRKPVDGVFIPAELSAATATSCMIDRAQFIDVLCLLPFLLFGTEESQRTLRVQCCCVCQPELIRFWCSLATHRQ
jgi:hypothetical protein